MKILKTTLIGVLAAVGALYLTFMLYATLGICEREVLSRSVSPGGNFSAEHVRQTCKGKIEVELLVGPARPGVRAEETGQVLFRAESDRDKEYALSIKPLRLWWESEKTLHVEYSKQEKFDLVTRLGEIELEVRRTE
jgi:hypothetical protein